MIYKFAITIVVLNLFFEIIENLFPIKNMNIVIKSASRVVMLYVLLVVLFKSF